MEDFFRDGSQSPYTASPSAGAVAATPTRGSTDVSSDEGTRTPSSLSTPLRSRANGAGAPVLVLSPASLVLQWADELRSWAYMSVGCVGGDGSTLARKCGVLADAERCVHSLELLRCFLFSCCCPSCMGNVWWCAPIGVTVVVPAAALVILFDLRCNRGAIEVVVASYVGLSRCNKLRSLASAMTWRVVVFDEVHVLKNKATQTYKV